MKFFRQIRVRLTLWYMLMIIIMVGGVSLFAYLRMSRYAHRYSDRLLDGELREAQAILKEEGLEGLRREIEFESKLGSKYSAHFRVYDEDAALKMQSKRFESLDLLSAGEVHDKLAGEPEHGSVRFGDDELRVLTASIKTKEKEKRYLIQIARSIKREAKLLEHLIENLVAFVPAILILSLVGGWLLARAGLKPMQRLSQQAALITDERLHERLPVRGVGDEIDQHAEILNSMLSRLEDSFIEIKDFAARASHELRTPLTALQLQIESAMHAEPAEARTILESSLGNLNRLSSLVQKLLFLTRAKAEAAETKFKRLDFCELVSSVCTDAAVLAGQKSIGLGLSTCDDAAVMGEETLLKQLAWNLIDNAIKHSAEGQRIDVAVEKDDGEIVLTVKDEGAGISPEDLPRLFEAFYRSRADSGTPGFGLGLNISRWICETHHGSIDLRNNPDRGATATVRIPLA